MKSLRAQAYLLAALTPREHIPVFNSDFSNLHDLSVFAAQAQVQLESGVDLIVEEADEDINRPWGTVERTFKAFCGTKPGALALCWVLLSLAGRSCYFCVASRWQVWMGNPSQSFARICCFRMSMPVRPTKSQAHLIRLHSLTCRTPPW